MKNMVVGDGIIGMLSSLLLAKDSDTVFLVGDNNNLLNTPDRYFSINLLSKYYFMKYDLWDEIIKDNIVSYNEIMTWDIITGKSINFNASSISFDNLGYIIKESSILTSLKKKISNIDNIKLITIEDILEIEEQDMDNILMNINKLGEVDIEFILHTNLRKNKLTEKLETTMHSIDYKQDALVLDIEMEETNFRNIAYQRFDQGQIQGLLPTSENTFNLIWSADRHLISSINEKSDSELLKNINIMLSEHIGSVKKINTRSKFSLSGFHVKEYKLNRRILIGGAAHSVHPLAGLGLNMGIQDIYILDEIFSKSKTTDDIFNLYDIECSKINNKYFHTINFLKLFYSNNIIPSIFKRRSIEIFDKNTILKNKIIKIATGVDLLEHNSKVKYCYSNN